MFKFRRPKEKSIPKQREPLPERSAGKRLSLGRVADGVRQIGASVVKRRQLPSSFRGENAAEGSLKPLAESRIKSLQRKVLSKTPDGAEREPVAELLSPAEPTPETAQFDEKPARQKVLRYRHIAALIVLWGVALVVIGSVFGLSLLRSSAAVNSETETKTIIKAGPITALSHFSLAREAAQAWENDVELVSASAKWDQPSLEKFEQPVEWFYRFYSPRLQHFLFVIVTSDGSVVARPHLIQTRREARRIDSASWTVDSPAALTTWLNDGGGHLWLGQSEPGPVSAQLQFSPVKNQPVWVVSGQDIGGRIVNYTLPAVSLRYQP